MRIKVRGTLLAILIGGFTAFMAPDRVAAQTVFGVQGNLATDADFGLGGRLGYNFEDIPLEGMGSFDVFFPGDEIDSWFEINANLFYHFHLEESAILPYLGGGLNVAILSLDTSETNGFEDDSNTEAGLNLGGGVRFPTDSSLTPFLEGRFVVGGTEQFVVTGGILFGDLTPGREP